MFPNLDSVFGALLQHDVGVPTEMFTRCLSSPALPAGRRNIIEQRQDNKIIRPCQSCGRPEDRPFVSG
ncbi:hypothetical protein KCP69_23140 [Salmonella enterica subsp. enterica]|nr:hypothetical protein KCP69_23140 [Salmonella enterica subsp. enterica]